MNKEIKMKTRWKFLREGMKSENGDCTWEKNEWKHYDHWQPIIEPEKEVHRSCEGCKWNELAYMQGALCFSCCGCGMWTPQPKKTCGTCGWWNGYESKCDCPDRCVSYSKWQAEPTRCPHCGGKI